MNKNANFCTDLAGQNLSEKCMSQLSGKSICRRRLAKLSMTNESRSLQDEKFNCRFLMQAGTQSVSIESCTPPSTYSYFSPSLISFIITVAMQILFVLGMQLRLGFN